MFARLTLILTILLATSFFTTGAHAEDRLMEKGRKAYSLAVSESMLSDMGVVVGENVVTSVKQNLQASGKSLSDEKAQVIVERFKEGFIALMTDVEDDIVKIYVDNLSERELDLMIEMYSDPEVAAMMAKVPAVTAEMMPLIQRAAPPLVQRIVGELEAEGLLAGE